MRNDLIVCLDLEESPARTRGFRLEGEFHPLFFALRGDYACLGQDLRGDGGTIGRACQQAGFELGFFGLVQQQGHGFDGPSICRELDNQVILGDWEGAFGSFARAGRQGG